MPSPIRIGISSCLLGQKVRYDGGDTRDALLMDTFGHHVEWVPVCPELELGLGVPREPIRLVAGGSRQGDRRGTPAAGLRATRRVRLVGVKSGADHTAAMQKYAKWHQSVGAVLAPPDTPTPDPDP